MTLDCEVVRTRSGELAMRDRISGEVMHPVVGPRVESRLLYVEPSRLQERLSEPISEPLVLLDVGLGAGSNAIAALEAAEALPASARTLRIVSFDHSLAALRHALEPEYAAAFGLTGDIAEAARAVLSDGIYRGERSEWRIELGELPSTLQRCDQASADIVFWDPFSPARNPSLWTIAAFRELRALCRPGATFFTYSAATSTRSALLLAGFAVAEGESTGLGKRTTQAALSHRDLARPLDRRWLQRLSRSSAPLPPEAPPDAFARIAALPQFSEA
ncbi:MAG: MnmC family methyltransferase [Myxococcota bacterium]